MESHRFVIMHNEGWVGFSEKPFYSFTVTSLTLPLELILLTHEFTGVQTEVYRWGNYEIVYYNTMRNLPPEEVEQLQHLLQENNVEMWHEFRQPANWNIHDSHFTLILDMNTGRRTSSIGASGYVKTPEGFEEVFPVLVNFLQDLAYKHFGTPAPIGFN